MKKIINRTAQPRTIMLPRSESVFLESYASAEVPDDYTSSEHAQQSLDQGVIAEVAVTEEIAKPEPTQQVPSRNTGKKNTNTNQENL